jgi:NAD(P)-dependent dehydrogenase (short-subunit alcohol dehydrogenase family)
LDLGLADKIAVVTGGSSGIGLATVDLLLGEGAKVAFCGRDEDRLETARRDLETRHDPDRILAAPCDVLDPVQVEKFRDDIVARFGATDILVANAGQARRSTFAETSDQDWRDEFELKFFGVIHPVRAFEALLERSECGAIVCVNALLSIQPETRLVATSAARAGLLNLVKSLSFELAPRGIRINSILLGVVDSGQWSRRYEQLPDKSITREDWLAGLARERGIPLGRFGRPAEPAAAIAFLASPAASYTTGDTIDVSGGQSRQL